MYDMTDDILIKFINDQLSTKEEEMVLRWLEEDSSNLKYYIQLKNLWVYQNLPGSPASNIELESIREKVQIYSKNHSERYFIGKRVKQLFPYSIAAIFAVAFFLNLSGLLFKKENIKTTITKLEKLSSDQKTVLYTEKGVKAIVTLPDGSFVNMNSGTKLIFPNKFDGNTREVYLSGEAFFSVKKDSLNPMVISTNKDFRISVLGTTFNLRAYENDDYASVTLYTGRINLERINLRTKEENIMTIKPMQSVLITSKSAPIVNVPADINSEIAWKEGYLVFESIPMSEVIKRLERWHGTEFIVKNNNVLKIKVTANFHSESIVQIMELLRFSTGINYELKENKVILK